MAGEGKIVKKGLELAAKATDDAARFSAKALKVPENLRVKIKKTMGPAATDAQIDAEYKRMVASYNKGVRPQMPRPLPSAQYDATAQTFYENFGSKQAREAKAEQKVQKAVAKAEKQKAAKYAVKTEGKRIVGAPADVKTPRQEAARRKAYKEKVEKGVQGALWYDDSGRAIMEHTGDNPDMARKVAGNFAITSSQTGVKPNTGFAIKGHNQAISGDPVKTGRFPNKMGPEVAAVYDAQGSASGLKRGPFEEQLALGGGFADPDIDPRAVHDIWDGRAWGYANPDGSKPFSGSFTAAQHRWQDEQLQKVMEDLPPQAFPWNRGRVQAASWSGEKIHAGEIKPDEAAYSYADDLPRHYGQGSRETVFGSNTGIMPEILSAPYELRQELHDRVGQHIYDDKGRDRIALGFDALTGPSFEGPGIYEGLNPGTQAQYALGTRTIAKGGEDGLPAGKAIDPSSMNLLRAIESGYGLLTGQKAVAGHRFFEDVPATSRNASELIYGSPIDKARAQTLLDIQRKLNIDPNSMAIVPSAQGVRIVDFGSEKDLFDKYLREAHEATGSEKPRGGFFHGMYEENPWDTDAGRYGQAYLNIIGERPAYQKAFDEVAPDIAAKLREEYRRFAKEHGMEIPVSFDEVLASISGGGERELRELIRKRGYGKAEGGFIDEDKMVTSIRDLLEKYLA